jgi:excisionase family DNA binding protein
VAIKSWAGMERATLTVGEVAMCLGINLPRAYLLVKEPGFPAMRIGRRILVPRAELETWLARQAADGVGPVMGRAVGDR